jgi:cytochrome c biogenesis protein CcmG/thiol:disulfide interchange protein DsbE
VSRYLLPLIAFAILIPIFVIGLGKDPSQLPSPLLQKPAPQFELPSVTDPTRTVGSASYANELAIVNVWATWCVGCRQEHGFLMQLAESGAIPIYGLNWRDNRAEAQRFLQQLGNPYLDSAYDEDGRVGIDWGVYGAPETFLIGADGTVLYKQLGPLSWGLWEQNFVPRIEAARNKQ